MYVIFDIGNLGLISLYNIEIWLFKLVKNIAIDYYHVHERKKARNVNIFDSHTKQKLKDD